MKKIILIMVIFLFGNVFGSVDNEKYEQEEVAYFNYILTLLSIEEESSTFIFSGDDELKNIKERELRLYLDRYFPKYNSSQILFHFGKYYEEVDDELRAKLTYLKHLFYFPNSKYSAKIKKNIRDLIAKNRRKSEMDIKLMKILDRGLPNTKIEVIESQRLYIMTLINLGNDDVDPIIEEAFFKLQVMAKPDDRPDEIIFWYAIFNSNMRKFKIAIEEYDKIGLIYPNSKYLARAIYKSAYIKEIEMKEYKRAIDRYNNVIEKFPNDSLALKSLQKIALIYYEKLDQSNIALEKYREIIENYSDKKAELDARFKRGEIYRKVSRPLDFAIEEYQIIVDEWSDNTEVAGNAMEIIGDIKVEMSELHLAIKQFVALADKYPKYKKNPEILYRSGGIAYDDLEEYKLAKKMYMRIVKDYPRSDYYSKSKKMIVKINKKMEK
ncbi:MAG: tetratricopeptide repeat protein [Candidatus Marinimicrobia bacterium]|nr:tetratricopeptide repeat protein [Candidatus Neomarinimicrobiota bacterium]